MEHRRIQAIILMCCCLDVLNDSQDLMAWCPLFSVQSPFTVFTSTLPGFVESMPLVRNWATFPSQNDDIAMGARRAFEESEDMQERDAWLRLPVTGCDGVPRSGQEWVRQGLLAATVISPPLMGDAMGLLATALKTGSQPPERTLVAPSCFPSIKELQDARGPAKPRP